VLQYLRWMWREAPRALRVEFLITILAIELLALATMVVLQGPDRIPSRHGERLEISPDR